MLYKQLDIQMDNVCKQSPLLMCIYEAISATFDEYLPRKQRTPKNMSSHAVKFSIRIEFEKQKGTIHLIVTQFQRLLDCLASMIPQEEKYLNFQS